MNPELTKYKAGEQVRFGGRVWTVKEMGTRRRPNRHLQPVYLLQAPYPSAAVRRGGKPRIRFTYTYQTTANIRRA